MDEVVFGHVVERGRDRQAADELGDEAELDQVFGGDVRIASRVALMGRLSRQRLSTSDRGTQYSTPASSPSGAAGRSRTSPPSSPGDRLKLHIGYSNSVTVEEMRRLLDIDPQHPKGTSRFRQTFFAGRIGRGDYEIYRPRPEGYTPDSLRARMPFRVPELALFNVDLSQATIVFYVRDDKEWLTDDALGLKVTDTIEVERFSFEE
jgi:hypothetical protein